MVGGKKTKINRFDRWMMAVTFAEAGDPKTALEVINQRGGKINRRHKGRQIEKRAYNRPVLRA